MNFLYGAYLVLTFGRGTRMKGKITKKAIDALIAEAKAAAGAVFLWDSELAGFGAKATASACSYVVQYRLGGRGAPTKRLTLGKHGVLTPDEARKRAKEELGQVAAGKDIAQERKDERAKLKAGTFRDLSESYFAVNGMVGNTGEWKSRHWKETHTMLEKSVYPVLGTKVPDAITKAELAALINKTKAHSHSVARRLHETLRPLFGWAFASGAIQGNPMTGLPCPKPVEARDRVLSDEEIKALWQAVTAEGWPFASVFKVLLLTGQRREEVAGMRWREVDLDAGTWTIAKERCKNGKAHTVDLSPEATLLLDPLGDVAAPRLMRNGEGKEDFVFSTTGRTPVSGFSKTKARIDARMREILGDKFRPWRTHDLQAHSGVWYGCFGFPASCHRARLEPRLGSPGRTRRRISEA